MISCNVNLLPLSAWGIGFPTYDIITRLRLYFAIKGYFSTTIRFLNILMHQSCRSYTMTIWITMKLFVATVTNQVYNHDKPRKKRNTIFGNGI